MSTETAAVSPRSDREQRRRFTRLNLAVMLVLAILAAGLGVAGALQGPRLSFAEVNPQAAITREGQRLLLHANQPVAPLSAEQVTIVPDVPVQVDVDGATITLRFERMLDYASDYTVAVDVVGLHTGASGRVEYTFSTPHVELFSLLRDPGGADDRIMRNSLSGSISNELAYSAPRIQQYAALDGVLAVVVLDADGAPSLRLVPEGGAPEVTVNTPAARTIRDLHASADGRMLGYVVDADLPDGEGRSGMLFVYDLDDGSGVAHEVAGFAGGPLEVSDWLFVPGSLSLVAQAQEQQLFLVDPLGGGSAEPLGQHAEMREFVPGTVRLVVADPQGGSTIDLATGETEPFEPPAPQIDPSLYPGTPRLLGIGSFAQPFGSLDYASSTMTSVLYLVDEDGTRVLFDPGSEGARIGQLCLSPNGRMLAVEVIAASGVTDGYPVVGGFSDTSIYYVDAATGARDRGVTGMLPDWCA